MTETQSGSALPTSRRRVLVLGREPSDFLCQLYRGIREAGNYDVDLLELRGVPERYLDKAKASFGTVHSPDFLRLRGVSLGTHLRNVCIPTFAKKLRRADGLTESVRGSLIARRTREIASRYDMIHVQQLTSDALDLLQYVPESTKLAFTFWGADLFLCDQHFPVDVQRRFLNRASLITVHSSAMKLILHAKFGPLTNAIVEPLIVVSGDDVFDRIDALKANGSGFSRSRVRAKFGADDNERVVIVGGSALPSGRHLEIIESLGQLETRYKSHFHFIFPLTYGDHVGSYVQSIRSYLARFQLKATLIEKYMSDREVAELRLAADISIKLPHYDSLSMALCEDIYSGCLPIVGAWLPYGPLRVAGVKLVEVEFVRDLSSVLRSCADNFNQYLSTCDANPTLVRSLLRQSRIVDEWTRVYRAVLNP